MFRSSLTCKRVEKSMENDIQTCVLTKTAEYVKWKRFDIWITQNTRNFNDYYKRELYNCVTRYFTSMMLVSADENDTVYNKYLEEVAAKKIRVATDIRKCWSYTDITIPKHFYVETTNKTVKFSCGDFFGYVNTERYDVLLTTGATTLDILLMLLNYAIFPSATLSWSIPSAVYKHLFETHGLTLEGCSSPMNSQLLLLGGEFCTPFDSDKVFGSKGDIFFTDLEGYISLLNPPFVEDFMLGLATYAISAIKRAKEPTTIIYVAPAWLDAQSHISLSNATCLVQRFDLTKGSYYYEDAISQTKIPATFNSTIFVLSNVKVDYFDMLLFFK